MDNLHPSHEAALPALPPGDGFPEDQETAELRTQIYGAPPKLLVRFYIGAERDFEKSQELGAPVYKDKIRALIQVPGDRDCLTKDCTADDAQKYPREWELFEQASKKPRAIPLEALPKMRPNIKEALAELGIRSVQELAANEVPEYLKPWKNWAVQINGIHEVANGKPKPKLRLVDGELVAA